MILSEMRLKIYLRRLKIVYNILVNGTIIAENVLRSDVRPKIEIIQQYYRLENSSERPLISVTLNKPETIA